MRTKVIIFDIYCKRFNEAYRDLSQAIAPSYEKSDKKNFILKKLDVFQEFPENTSREEKAKLHDSRSREMVLLCFNLPKPDTASWNVILESEEDSHGVKYIVGENED